MANESENGSGYSSMDDRGKGSFLTQGGFARGGIGDDDSEAPGPGATRPQFFFNKGNEFGEARSEESVGEVDIPVIGVETTTETAASSEEVGNSQGEESGEEFVEASPDQLRANASESATEAGEEGFLDSIGGMAGGLFGGEAAEQAEVSEAGAVLESGSEAGQEEFFPFLAAMVPMLVSSIGPAIGKKLMKRLSPLAKQGIKRIAAAGINAVGKKVRPGRNLLGTIARLLESAENMPGTESGTELSPEADAVITEALSTLEVIIGEDNRQLFQNTTSSVHRRICLLRITYPNGKSFRGTGFFIGRRTLATAGHCVYMHSQGGWARKIQVSPGANGTARPFNSATATSFRSVRGWVDGKKPEHDYGCIVLPTGAFNGRDLGFFAFAQCRSPELLAKVSYLKGYPGDKPEELWGMKRQIKSVTAKTLIYDIDTVGGQSGAPVYVRQNGIRYVVGIHNYGNSGGNSATRITSDVYARLNSWKML